MIIAFITVKTGFAVFLGLGSIFLVLWDARDSASKQKEAEAREDAANKKVANLETQVEVLTPPILEHRIINFLAAIDPRALEAYLSGERHFNGSVTQDQFSTLKQLVSDDTNKEFISIHEGGVGYIGFGSAGTTYEIKFILTDKLIPFAEQFGAPNHELGESSVGPIK